jgi:hypothetical protein
MVDLINSILCIGCGTEVGKCEPVKCRWYEENVREVSNGVQKWLSSFDSSSATKCFEAVNILKERLNR